MPLTVKIVHTLIFHIEELWWYFWEINVKHFSIPMKNILVGVYIFRVCTKMNMIQNGFWQKIVLRVYLYKCIYTYTKYYFQSFLFQFPRRGSSTRLCVVGFPRRYCKTFLFQDWWNHLKESRMVLFKALGLSREFNSKD